MKIERVKITDLMTVLLNYLSNGTEYIDLSIIPEENTIKITKSSISKKEPENKNLDDLKEPI